MEPDPDPAVDPDARPGPGSAADPAAAHASGPRSARRRATVDPAGSPGRRRRGVGVRFLIIGDVLDAIIILSEPAAAGADDSDATIRHRPDGSGANTASWLGWAGTAVDFVGRVGVDDVYRHEQELRRAGVLPHLTYDRDACTGNLVTVPTSTGRRVLIDPGANRTLDLHNVQDDLLSHADLVHVAGGATLDAVAADLADLVTRARTAGARVSVDRSSSRRTEALRPESFLTAVAGADLLFTDLEEGRTMTGHAAPDDVARALTEHVPLVVLTLGAGGVLVGRANRAPIHVPALEVAEVDALGASDAFAAGFLRAWATDPVRIRVAAQEGLRFASRSLRLIGGRPPA